MSGTLCLESDEKVCPEDTEEDSFSFSEDEFFVWSETDRRCRKHPVCWLCFIAVCVLLGPFAVALHDQSLPKATVEWIIDKLSKPLDKPTDPVADASLALIIGFGQQQIVQSSVLVDIAFGLVFCGTLTATVIATLEPDAGSVPKDFLQKATLSNMAQDMTQPQGRLWSTALGLASVLSVVSMYTFWLYRSWQPFVGDNNPLHSPVLQSSLERRLRIAWALAPNVGFVLAAMVPSLSDVAGYEIVLTAVHNVSAPLSMLFLMVMETIQLGYGENAFAYFFSQDATPLYGPLTKYQRMRVCLLVEAWISGTIFVAVQGYLAFRKNRRYWVALTSYYGEVIGIILAFSLPAAAAMDIRHMTNIVHSSVLAETAVVIPLIYQSGLNETIQSISQHMASKAAEMGG
ncbi:unnamed protein product [Symbiodinium natans]|uniref:Uncharacterized protein n=1 Tax=Symbiodinium natans TaxID=878477 RepID=A0A812J4U6_9DINO|nr:unnamed protein product [Symbiodinium natans]